MSEVNFRIVDAYPDKDDRGRPNLTYVIADEAGGFNSLNTPINSQLSRLLRPDLEREDDISIEVVPPEFSDGDQER